MAYYQKKSGNKDFKDGKFMKNLEKNFGINKNFWWIFRFSIVEIFGMKKILVREKF